MLVTSPGGLLVEPYLIPRYPAGRKPGDGCASFRPMCFLAGESSANENPPDTPRPGSGILRHGSHGSSHHASANAFIEFSAKQVMIGRMVLPSILQWKAYNARGL